MTDTAQKGAFAVWFMQQATTQEELPSLLDAWQARQPEIDAKDAEIARNRSEAFDLGYEARAIWENEEIERLERALIQITTMNTKSIAQPLMVIHGIAKDALAAAEKEQL
jgi:hypothetical protein